MNHLQKGNAASWLVMLAALFASARPAQADASPEPADFGFLSWDAAPPYFQGHAEPTSQPRVLWIETGRYSLAVDTRRLEMPHAGNLKQSRETVLTSDRKKARALPAGLFDLRVIANGEMFSCEGVRESKNTWAYPVRFVETGRWLQHVDLDGLILRSREGREMEADAHLEISAWPDRATFLAEVKPRVSVTNLTVLLAAEARGLQSESVTTTANSAYGTRPIALYKEGQVVYTQKGRMAYAIYLAPQEGGRLPATVNLKSLRPKAGSKVQMLGSKAPLKWQTNPAGATALAIPAATLSAPPCQHAFVFRFEPEVVR